MNGMRMLPNIIQGQLQCLHKTKLLQSLKGQYELVIGLFV